MDNSRVAQFLKLREKKPDDPFLNYALGIEHLNGCDYLGALGFFEFMRNTHPDYVATYLHLARTLVALERVEDARQVVEDGIAVAERIGDTHAASELRREIG